MAEKVGKGRKTAGAQSSKDRGGDSDSVGVLGHSASLGTGLPANMTAVTAQSSGAGRKTSKASADGVGIGSSSYPPIPGYSSLLNAYSLSGLTGGSSSDMDVTVLAFAQWVSEVKNRDRHAQQQLQAEMSIIRNAIHTNNTELCDFKRNSVALQKRMQADINEIREQLSRVFADITSCVRHSTEKDREFKLKLQMIHELLVHNENLLDELKTATEHVTASLRSSVEDVGRRSDTLEQQLKEVKAIQDDTERCQKERLTEMFEMVDGLDEDVSGVIRTKAQQHDSQLSDVHRINESLASLATDFTEHCRTAETIQQKLQQQIFPLDQSARQQLSHTYSYAPQVVGGLPYPPPPMGARMVPPGMPSYPAGPAPLHPGTHTAIRPGGRGPFAVRPAMQYPVPPAVRYMSGATRPPAAMQPLRN
ncbi:unnamed protein product [Vitrella brassicaformis CCMP3155]|uniref:Uncharacterized protein n=2 Tax=Vitrella brassicaformis TaxID=1169539 RepID=A0A0G4EKA8_VITBC|nr:unnamed protein product [Vitrella brassicaformis CCMP3155]|eukprot:CEL96856.1 unnamed protein product [Vitrella brassicaformis CCMP3155]